MAIGIKALVSGRGVSLSDALKHTSIYSEVKRFNMFKSHNSIQSYYANVYIAVFHHAIFFWLKSNNEYTLSGKEQKR